MGIICRPEPPSRLRGRSRARQACSRVASRNGAGYKVMRLSHAPMDIDAGPGSTQPPRPERQSLGTTFRKGSSSLPRGSRGSKRRSGNIGVRSYCPRNQCCSSEQWIFKAWKNLPRWGEARCHGTDRGRWPEVSELSASQAIGLALHELATNSGKYGAPSVDTATSMWAGGLRAISSRRARLSATGPYVADSTARSPARCRSGASAVKLGSITRPRV
jgi:hypothetical protein